MKTIIVIFLCMVGALFTFGQDNQMPVQSNVEEVKVTPPRFTGDIYVVQKLKEEKKLLLARLKTMIESQTSLLDIEIQDDEVTASAAEPEEKPVVKKKDSSEINVDDILEKLL